MYTVTNEISQKNANAVLADGFSAIAQGQLEFDFSGLERADSVTVVVMLAWLRRALEQQQLLEFHSVPAALLSLIQLYGLTAQFPIVSPQRH